MKTKIVSTILLGCAISAFADSGTANSAGTSNVTMSAVTFSSQVVTMPGPAIPPPPSANPNMPNNPPTMGMPGPANPPPLPPNAVVGPNMPNSHLQMSLQSLPNQSQKVLINLAGPGFLTVYDQAGKIAFTSSLPAGKVTIDTKNFPLGNDKLVVTTNQNGSSFTLAQNVMVASNVTVPASGS